MKNFEFIIPERIVFGAGSINKLAEKAKGLGTKALIVTGKSKRPEKSRLIEKVTGLLDEAGIRSIVFDEVEPNPRSTTCNRAASICRDNGCDITVGIGGGSSMDAAKLIALAAVNDGQIEDYMPGGKYADKPEAELVCLPVICISTTSGTGSEATPFAVVTNPQNGNKPGLGYDFWYPRISIIDPELMVSMPTEVTRNTGLDVLFHALEAFISKTATPASDIFAAEAIRLVIANLKKVLDSPEDIEARSRMAWANTLAGIAISNGGTIAIHGMAHPIGGHTDATHGAALSAIAPSILEYTWKSNPEKYAALAKLLGAEGGNTPDTAAECSVALKNFLNNVGQTYTATDLGVTDELIPVLTEDALFTMSGAMENTWMTLSVDDAKKIYKNAL